MVTKRKNTDALGFFQGLKEHCQFLKDTNCDNTTLTIIAVGGIAAATIATVVCLKYKRFKSKRKKS